MEAEVLGSGVEARAMRRWIFPLLPTGLSGEGLVLYTCTHGLAFLTFKLLGPTKTSRPSCTRRGFLWKNVERAVPGTPDTSILFRQIYSLIKDQ
jgi:hypothetical protein